MTMNHCQADRIPMFEHAADVARERAGDARPEPAPIEPTLHRDANPMPTLCAAEIIPVALTEPPRAPTRGRPHLARRPSIIRRQKANGEAFFIAQVREIGGERTYLGSYRDQEAAMHDCLAYMQTGEKPRTLQSGRPRGSYALLDPEERREYHRAKGRESAQRWRDRQKASGEARKPAATAFSGSGRSLDRAEGVPTAARAEFLARRLVMIREVARRGA